MMPIVGLSHVDLAVLEVVGPMVQVLEIQHIDDIVAN